MSYPRRLPVPVAPYSAETLASYIARMAAANHLQQHTLAAYLHQPGTPGARPAIDRLAATSGSPVLTLQRALPELGSRHPWWCREQPRLVCLCCSAARGITGPVTHWVPNHPDICVRHRRWIGPTVGSLAEQHDLSGLADVVAAAFVHHRLVRRHGLVSRAYNDALRVNMRWAERGCFGRHRDRRLRLLGGPRPLAFDDPAMHAAVYPETVRLTSIMVERNWVEMAASRRTRDTDRFYTEVARRLDLPEYQPDSSHDPLVKWVAAKSPAALTVLRHTSPEMRHFH